MNKKRLPPMMTGRRPYLTLRPFVTKQEIPMAKTERLRGSVKEFRTYWPSPDLRSSYCMTWRTVLPFPPVMYKYRSSRREGPSHESGRYHRAPVSRAGQVMCHVSSTGHTHHAPTTAVSMLKIRSRRSFFHIGQFNGSLGLSLG